MSISSYGSLSNVDSAFDTIISPSKLNALLTAMGAKPAYYVTETAGDQSVTTDFPGIPGKQDDVVLVEDKQAVSDDLDQQAMTLNAAGVPVNGLGADATYVTNNFATPDTIYATDSAFVELQGTATVDGGNARTFVVDASHDTSDVSLNAGYEPGSYSWLIGGSGSDTLTGSASSTGSAVMTAGSGPTTINGGAGEATMYGGGATTMIGGSHPGQLFIESNNNSSDTMIAGAGGSDTMSVWSGDNVLNDSASKGGDSLNIGTDDPGKGVYTPTGTTTVDGSLGGTTISLWGASHVAIANLGGTETINASSSSVDSVSFLGQNNADLEAQRLADISKGQSSMTVKFTAADGKVQDATLNNITHIQFK